MKSKKIPPEPDFEILAKSVYREFGEDPHKALALADRGLAQAKKLKHNDGIAKMTLARAHSLRESGKYRESLREYDRAATLFRSQKDIAQAWRTVIGKLDALDQIGDYRQALKLASQASAYFRKSGLRLWAAKVDANTGNLYQHQDRYEDALRYYNRAYPVLFREQPLDGMILLFNQATTYLSSARPAKAIEQLLKCRDFFAQQDLTSFLARTYYNLSYGYYLLGKYQDALQNLTEAAKRLTKLQDRSFLASCYLDESELYLRLNRTEEAIEKARIARSRFQELRMPYEQAESSAILGIGLLRQDQTQRAIPYLKEAKAIFARQNNATKSAELEAHLALALMKMKKPDEAIRSLKRAYDVFKKQSLNSRALSTLTYLANAYREARKPRQALAILRKGQRQIGSVPLPWVLVPYYRLRGSLEAELGIHSAEKHLQKAIRLTESIRSEIPSEELRISYFRDKLAPYNDLITMGLQKGNPRGVESAFLTAERARSRVLLDLMEGSIAFNQDQPEMKQVLGEMAALGNESWRRSVGVATPTKPDVRERHLERRVLALMRQSQVARAAVSQEKLSVSQLAKSLQPKQAIVSYYIQDEMIHAFILDQYGLSAYPAIASAHDLLPRWQLLRFQIERGRFDPGDSLESCEPHLRALGNALIGSLYSRLRKSRLWTIIPHGWLHALPFHALRDANGYLVERHLFSYAPSASIYLRCRKAAIKSEEVLLMGQSDELAPWIDHEIHEIREVFPKAIALNGSKATSTTLQEHGPNARIIHIASHGRFLKEKPFFSGLLLADGWLTLPQIYKMKLKADLVTLSGCETGGQEVAAGDELLGLVRGFLYAGASTMMVSLWRVFDISTAYFMRQFYSELSAGLSKTEAWQSAVLHTKETWQHPYFWSPFALIGTP